MILFHSIILLIFVASTVWPNCPVYKASVGFRLLMLAFALMAATNLYLSLKKGGAQ